MNTRYIYTDNDTDTDTIYTRTTKLVSQNVNNIKEYINNNIIITTTNKLTDIYLCFNNIIHGEYDNSDS